MEYIVIQNFGMESESIYYAGESEMEAFRSYKKIAGLGQRNIFKAKIKRIYWKHQPVIDRYEVLEKIR
jgi:hypothetical protein